VVIFLILASHLPLLVRYSAVTASTRSLFKMGQLHVSNCTLLVVGVGAVSLPALSLTILRLLLGLKLNDLFSIPSVTKAI
jgi:hypothetical protein